MGTVPLIIVTMAYIAGSLLLVRGAKEKLLARFPFFYSYLTFSLAGSLAVYALSWLVPALHARVYWWHYLVTVLAEFAVIVEISDHLFEPYPAIRGLGRLLVASISVLLFLVYVLPSLATYPSSSAFLLGFIKKASTLKAVALLAVLGVASRYRLNGGRNISGMALGFGVYLGINLAHFALAERYGTTFRLGIPVAFTLALVIWTVALWSYRPASPTVKEIKAAEGLRGSEVSYELDRMNVALTRLLRGR